MQSSKKKSNMTKDHTIMVTEFLFEVIKVLKIVKKKKNCTIL
jgi:hypothetical protein